MASQSIRLNLVLNDMVDRTNQAVGETSARRKGALGSGGVDFHRTCYTVRPVLLDSAHATGRHLRQESMLNCAGRAVVLENRNRETGDLEGRWESAGRACFEGLLGAGLQNDDRSAVCHNARLGEEMAVLHLAHVCVCWIHSASTSGP
jgi:hypothetical protein